MKRNMTLKERLFTEYQFFDNLLDELIGTYGVIINHTGSNEQLIDYLNNAKKEFNEYKTETMVFPATVATEAICSALHEIKHFDKKEVEYLKEEAKNIFNTLI